PGLLRPGREIAPGLAAPVQGRGGTTDHHAGRRVRPRSPGDLAATIDRREAMVARRERTPPVRRGPRPGARQARPRGPGDRRGRPDRQDAYRDRRRPVPGVRPFGRGQTGASHLAANWPVPRGRAMITVATDAAVLAVNRAVLAVERDFARYRRAWPP